SGPFVVVAQNNNQFTVVGYSPTGNNTSNVLPPMLLSMIDLIENSEGEINLHKQKSLTATVVVEPLLDSKGIQLNQYHHENMGGCPTGCVATAFAQIMAFHQYPDKGVGSHCYVHPRFGELCADFENTSYNWINPTDEDYKKLSTHLAIAMDMNFCGGMYGSAPSAGNYLSTLQKYFNYFVIKENSTIKNELDQGRPVYIELQGDPTGHAAVVDGYDNDGWYHINFGWGGAYNGYYPLFNKLKIDADAYTFSTYVEPTYIWKEASYVNPTDSLVLVKLQSAFHGSTGWDLSTPVYGWDNVEVLNGRVVQLYIENQDYTTTCSIPDEIALLTELRELTIMAYLTGELTTEITNLTNLKSIKIFNLDYYDPNFSFQLTPEIGNWSKMEVLKIANPKGTIPSSIGDLVELNYLDLNWGQLSGELPVEIGNLLKLRSLELNNNELSGSIPSSLGALTNLETLDLSSNQFSAIEDGNWNCPKIDWLLLSNNHLEGTLPESFKSMINLRRLAIDNNKISSLPEGIGFLNKLESIRLENNLIESIPSSWANLINLNSIYAANNKLSSLPDDFSGWIKLHTFDLHANKLTEFPASLCLLPKIQKIDLHDNCITEFPVNIHSLSETIEELYLQNNALHDDIPLRLLSDTTIKYLNLDANQFVFQHIPQSEKLRNPAGSSSDVKLIKNRIKVMMGDTITLDIKALYPYAQANDAYFWSVYPDNISESYPYKLEAQGINESSTLQVIIDETTLNTQYYCKIFNAESPSCFYHIYYDGKWETITRPVLMDINTEPITFELATEIEILAGQYPGKRVVESVSIANKIIEDKTVTLVAPVRTRGLIYWQISADGNTWHDASTTMSESELKANIVSADSKKLIVSPKTAALYRCKIIDTNCEPLYSDTLKIQPFGTVLVDEVVNVTKGSCTITTDSIEVTIPANLHDKDFRITIVKMDNPPSAPDSVIMGGVYDVRLSFGDEFALPLLIKMKVTDKKSITDLTIDRFKAVYFDEESNSWINYKKAHFSVRDSMLVFETDHLTKLSYWTDPIDWLSGYTDWFKLGNIQVIYRDSDVVTMNSTYNKHQKAQPWHIAGYPLFVQDAAYYLSEVMTAFKSKYKLAVPDGVFTIYIKNNADYGNVGIMGMIDGYLTIHRAIDGPEKLRSLIAHEFMHYTQDEYVLAQSGNTFWLEATAHLTDRMIWDENTLSPSESELYLLEARQGDNSILDFLSNSWDYWDKSFVTQNKYGNIQYCYLAGTFLHYMRSFRPDTTKLKPEILLKETDYSLSWREYLNSYIKKHLKSTIGDEYESFVKYCIEGSNSNFTLLGEGDLKPYSYLMLNSYSSTKDAAFTSLLNYNFPFSPAEYQKKDTTLTLQLPYLSSQLVLLHNNGTEQPIAINYKRLHEVNKENRIYYGKYNPVNKQMQLVDITDSTTYTLLIEENNSSNKEYANIAFLLLINKQNPAIYNFFSDFNAKFELSASPLLNIKDVALVRISTNPIHSYSDGTKRQFIISGDLDMSKLNTGLQYKKLYFHSNKTGNTDSTYTVKATFGYVLSEPQKINDLAGEWQFDIEQIIEYDFNNAILHIDHKLVHTSRIQEYMELPSKIIKPSRIERITEDRQKVTLHNIRNFTPVQLPIYGDVVHFSTKNTAETMSIVDKVSHTFRTIEGRDETYYYKSTDYSQEDIIVEVYLHYK
ncbi:MAG: C10 family peptidase, partial [Paludibacter sp.]|nr:C10 family peptidase [Paludibacter sp.]